MKSLCPTIVFSLSLALAACKPAQIVESGEFATASTAALGTATSIGTPTANGPAGTFVPSAAVIPPTEISTTTEEYEVDHPTETLTAVIVTVIPASVEAVQVESSRTPFAMQEITLADQGKTFVMYPGESFILNLGAGVYDWSVEVDNPAVLSRETNSPSMYEVQGIYRANAPGQAVLTAYGNPKCIRSTPPCLMPSLMFKITLIVQ